MKVSLKSFMGIQHTIHEVRDRLEKDGVKATYL
jgi:hypothetical protein